MKFLFTIITLFISLNLFSQRYCATDEYNANKVFRSSNSYDSDNSVDLTTKYVINVVVHLLEDSSAKPGELIKDADVDYIIDCLNRDFNLENSDTSILTDTLKSLPGDMKIRFQLAEVDPDGYPTSGITRKRVTGLFGYSNDPIKFDSLGGVNAWDTKKYFNIWAGPLFPGLLGYSQFPGGDSLTDGIAVQSDIMRYNPVNYPHYSKGRVITHEIGHSLSLRHPWGNAWACGDNMVSDIPTQNGPNYNCPDTTLSLCYGDTTRDVVKHYMDYCGDTCMVMFTKGQVYNARRAIQKFRMDLVTIDYPATVEKEEIKEKEKILLYPTITNGDVNISLPPTTNDVTISVYNNRRKLIIDKKVNGENISTIDLSNVSNGTYIVMIRFADGTHEYIGRIVKVSTRIKSKLKDDIETDESWDEDILR